MVTDCQLLSSYVASQDSAAFRDLVDRHGPLVLHVCRQLLRDPSEIDDAFQATFLVLVRKAPSIRDPEKLGSWLYGVAYRVALRAKRRKSKRTEHERRRAEMLSVHSYDRPWDDLQSILREELERLPEHYRSPIELCYVDGLTHEEASIKLGQPLGTLKTRLVRGRRLLQERLSRRGVAPGLALLLILLLSRDSAAAVPESLAESTVEAMSLDATGKATLLQSRFPGAAQLAASIGAVRLIAKLMVLFLFLGVSVGAVGATVIAKSVFAQPDETADLPMSLTDVLKIDCR